VKKLLQTLTETFGPSGYEQEVRELVRQEVQPFADEIHVDALGNLIARKRPGKTAPEAKRIMIAAHMDEIGVMVSHVDKNGFVRFSPIGNVFRRYVLGGRVRFLNGTQGVIGFDRLDNVNVLPTLDKIYIDVGATSQNDSPVKIGDVAAFDRSYTEFGDRLVAKSLGSRVGVLIAIETLRNLKPTPYDVYFVFTTQSEVGGRGVATSAYGVDPDIGIALDVAPAGDTPNSHRMEIVLGNGPCIKIQGTDMIVDPRVVNWMIRAAEKNKIPHQREVLLMEGSGAGKIQSTRGGVPSGCISVPLRYIHSPSEMVDLFDVQNAIKLLAAVLRTPVGL
jgi:endoglucanase